MSQTLQNEFALQDFAPTHKSAVRDFVDIRDISKEAKCRLRISEDSFYHHNEWKFNVEYPDLEPSERIIRFGQIVFNDGTDITNTQNRVLLEQIKDYIYTMLVDPPSTYPKLYVINNSLKTGVRWLCQFMLDEGIKLFSDLTENDAEEFLDYIVKMPKKQNPDKPFTNRTLQQRVNGLNWLIEQSPKFDSGLRFNIFGDYKTQTTWARAVADTVMPRGVGVTPQIPDEVARELFDNAMQDLRIAECLDEIYQAEKDRRLGFIQQRELPHIKKNIYRKHGYVIKNTHIRKVLEAELISACYSIVAMLTGMRVHEVLALEYDSNKHWVCEEIETDGRIMQLYFVRTTTKKLEPEPKKYQWQTVPIVKRALEALQLGMRRYNDAGNPFLFPKPRGKWARSRSTINNNLRVYLANRSITHNGEAWPLATHQFRKTFARIMIRQGLGLKALQDQLKHYDIAMTQMYGDPTIYYELQQEKFVLSKELMEEVIGTQVPIIGGGAGELQEMRKEFQGMTKTNREKFLESLPKKGLIEQMDDGLCFYRPKKALCGGDKVNCRPADCNNSWMPAVGKEKSLIYRRNENLRLMNLFKNQPFKLAHLKSRNEEIDKLHDQLINLKNVV
jgi:integrase